MPVYIALLRGINVGGKTIIYMADLRQTLTRAGFTNVQTFIQSGNILLIHMNVRLSKLAQKLGLLGREVTLRNWNTIRNLTELAHPIPTSDVFFSTPLEQFRAFPVIEMYYTHSE